MKHSKSSYRRFEGFFKAKKDKESIFYQVWQLSSEVNRPWVIITHGQGEHSDCYQRLIEGLEVLQCHFLAWDLRGHGRSSGKRGYAPTFFSYVDDFVQFVEISKEITQNQKCFWLGHSLGGLIQILGLKAANCYEDDQILSNPYLGLSMEVPLIKDLGSALLYYFFPKLCLWNQIKNEMLTRDSKVLEEYKKDPLRHHKISAGVYLGALEAQDKLFKSVKFFTNSVLLQLSERDPIVSSEKAKLFFELIPSQDKTLKIYPHRAHELYNDLGREEVFQDVIEWIQKRM